MDKDGLRNSEQMALVRQVEAKHPWYPGRSGHSITKWEVYDAVKATTFIFGLAIAIGTAMYCLGHWAGLL